MTISEIYEAFDKIGCLSFSTWDGKKVVSRIAHFFAYDDGGVYFSTMNTKPFYKQLKTNGILSVCGQYPKTQVDYDENNLPFFAPGYTARMSGEVRELTLDEVLAKGKENKHFNVAGHDMKKYPATKIFVMHKASGDIFDFDFAKKNRDHKLERVAFAFGGAQVEQPGVRIEEEKCISCGACFDVCSFNAIKEDMPYSVLANRCDECGNCIEVCPVNAIRLRAE